MGGARIGRTRGAPGRIARTRTPRGRPAPGVGGALALLLAATLPGLAPAQEAVLHGERGWIGISFTVETPRRPVEPEDLLPVLTRVWENSPAARAGLLPGDTIRLLNGRLASGGAFAELGRRLRPGDRVELVIVRGGEDRTVRLEAAERPAYGLLTVSPEIRVRMDSVQTAMVRFLADSARLVPAPGVRLQGVRIDTLPRVGLLSPERYRILVEGDTIRRLRLGSSITVDGEGEGPGPWAIRDPEDMRGAFRVLSGSEFQGSFPFGAFVARSQATDSLLEAVRGLRERLESARREELERQRELAEAMARESRRIDRSDPRLQELRRSQEGLRARLEATERALERESRRELLARSRVADSLVTRARIEAGAPDASRVRFMTPHLVGRTVVAGADLLPLNEGLGQYFGTEEGVLVAEVVAGSPAEDAGLAAGDVIVTVGGQPVRSVEEVRRALGARAPGGAAELLVIRKGERVRIQLR